MSLRILKPGPQSTLQDQGRKACQHLGLSQSGAMDKHAYNWANYLLGNSDKAACVEITLGPFIAEFQAPTLMALCGAEVNATLDDKPICNWQSHRVNAGSILSIKPGKSGLRSYLSVRGGFKSVEFYQSCSEVPREKLFPPQIQKNSLLSYAATDPMSRRITAVPERYIPNYLHILHLRCYPTYQYSEFSEQARARFSQQVFTISPRADRMGYRLQGIAVSPESRDADPKGNDSETNNSGGTLSEGIVSEGIISEGIASEGIASEGIALGSVQIPPDGQPIVLLNDRQTLGGYPKIGCVNQWDCSQLAQRRPGQDVQFHFVPVPTEKQNWMLAKNFI